MDIPSDDEIQRFFDSIKPEDFLKKPDVAASEVDNELFPRHGDNEFERFWLDNLQRLAQDEEPFAALHNGTEHRRYLPLEDEDLAEFLVRVTQDAKQFDAKWFFVGTPGEASMGAVFDPTDSKDVENARRSGRMMNVTNWYAESVEPDSRGTRFGIIFHEGEEQRIVQSTYEQGANPAFRRVLHS